MDFFLLWRHTHTEWLTVKQVIFACRKFSWKSGDSQNFPAREYYRSSTIQKFAKFSCREPSDAANSRNVPVVKISCFTVLAYNSEKSETRKLVQICGYSRVRPGGWSLLIGTGAAEEEFRDSGALKTCLPLGIGSLKTCTPSKSVHWRRIGDPKVMTNNIGAPFIVWLSSTDFAVQTKSDLWQRKGSVSPPPPARICSFWWFYDIYLGT